MKDINIVIVNYRMRDDVMKAIASLVADVSPDNVNAQVTVVDNSNNTDGIREEMSGKLRDTDKLSFNYLEGVGNVGFGKGCNIGFAHSPARYYCTINPDIVVPENSHTVQRIIKFMEDHPKIGMIGPKLLNTDGTIQDSCYRFDLASILVKPFKHINFDKKYKWIKKHADKLMMKDFNHDETGPVDWVMGSAMIARKEATDIVGFFDDKYFMYLEDCDWCHKMWEAGWPVYYVHDIIIRHKHMRESARVPGVFQALIKNRLARIHLKNWFRYVWKWRANHKYYAT